MLVKYSLKVVDGLVEVGKSPYVSIICVEVVDVLVKEGIRV